MIFYKKLNKYLSLKLINLIRTMYLFILLKTVNLF